MASSGSAALKDTVFGSVEVSLLTEFCERGTGGGWETGLKLCVAAADTSVRDPELSSALPTVDPKSCSVGFTTTGFSCSCSASSSVFPEPRVSSPTMMSFFVFDDAACPLSHSPSPEGEVPLSVNCLWLKMELFC